MEDLLTVKEILSLPVVVKPVDLTGGKGVKVCHSWKSVEKQVSETVKLTRESKIIIEEYNVCYYKG